MTMKEVTKNDLQVNDIVTVRENKTYMVHQFNTELIFVSKVAFLYSDGYTDDLIRKLNDAALDIIKVQRPVCAYQLQTISWSEAPVIWERANIPLLSTGEYHILKNVEPIYEFIARDYNGGLYLFETHPDKKSFVWDSDDSAINIKCHQHIFKFVKWEDDEPWEITKLLERYEEEHNHGN